MSDTRGLPYWAGFLDGEGCFTFTGSITIKCAHTYYPALKALQEEFGGTIGVHKHESHKKRAWVWSIHSVNAKNACERLLPFLLEKKSQAEILLEYHETVGPRGRKVSSEVKSIRKDLRECLLKCRSA